MSDRPHAITITNPKAGGIVAQIGRESNTGDNELSTYHCKIDLSSQGGNDTEHNYRPLPKYYDFGNMKEKEKILRKNMILIRQEVEEIIALYIE